MCCAEDGCLNNPSINRPAVAYAAQHLNNSQDDLSYLASMDQSVEHLK